ncbi:flavodoxin [Parabacteroides distasonis]|uniref:flavodoxin n=1 Tax=Parabacteroides distasonis TaxID=823 RepID=UPI00189FA342|nr:flavodoxin [Parabacteroides distasonis]MDB9152923.1 flavodoxin [Parabacteroides distasonis]MDB9157500.1 flavodoxin [Parabacteroides distasonis]MDB9163963.1 flavodoxin [Parabacteroides distasonis]MDB9167795.1 flavodoxin [Parabacteroides distasonis]MDB9197059.1 flavodoxin [Parabacteroides distasonis]
MKQLSTVFALLLTLFSTVSCAQGKTGKATKTLETSSMETGKKILVAFFSHTGENYAVGNITKGNTHIIAEMIAESTDGKLFEIVSVKEYPKTYNACVEVAKKEKEAGARPAVKDDIAVEDYDVVFIGYPNWWGDMPMAVYTFIERHRWAGKTIIPFCTHEGSGLSNTEKYIANACKGAKVEKGLAVRGATAQNKQEQARKAVVQWLERLGL